MAIVQEHPLIRCTRQLAARLTDLSDRQLLERFSSQRDELSFEVLVRRHGSLVLGACLRILGDRHAAEDACQGTFLLLARKAEYLQRPEALGPWLYGVATRTALKARSKSARLREVERRAAVNPTADQADNLVWRDLRPILDEAIAGLPAKYREPFVLHHLQELTVADIARRLGCPQGTVSARLARAREQLRTRLTRQGLTLSAGALAAALSEGVARACPPALLVVFTVQAAKVATGQTVFAGFAGTVSASAAALVRGGGSIMATLRVAVVLLAVGTFGLGAGLFAPQAGPGPARAEGAAPPQKTGSAKLAEPGSAGEADLLLFLDGSAQFFRGEYRDARKAFERLTAMYPRSQLFPKAVELASLSKYSKTSAPLEAVDAAEGCRLIRSALGGEKEFMDMSAAVVDNAQEATEAKQRENLRTADAEKAFATAEFYRRTGHPGSACFYYELVRRRYAGTRAALKAGQRLRELGKSAAGAEKNRGDRRTRVGSIIIRGDTEAPKALVLYQARLYPGRLLSYPDLEAARRNLAQMKFLAVKVHLLDADNADEFRTILIQVELKSWADEVGKRSVRLLCKPEDYGAVFEQVSNALGSCFKIGYTNRYDGQIETEPAVVKPGLRRRATARITAPNDGGYWVEVTVINEVETKAKWKPAGHDEETERAILRCLLADYARTGDRKEGPSRDGEHPSSKPGR